MALSAMLPNDQMFSAVARFLSDDAEFEQATRVAQIFSAICFAGLGSWLAFTNGTKLTYVQRASLEKRLEVACYINCYVAIFSAFFNAFQLTEIDNIVLPRASNTNFVLDFARPVEWIATCPLMQLVLVLMGGSRIPEYRLWAMPALAVIILLWGTASMLLEEPWIRFLVYAGGFATAMLLWFLIRQGIIEHSNGAEGLFKGESEFRKASALVIATWFPFPIWFIISPEGLGLITNVLVIQMGWAFLNIVSKFTFIFYIQRVKDNYCNRLKVRREMYGSGAMDLEHGSGNPSSPSRHGSNQPNDHDKAKNELAAVVVETMNFLAMSQHAERFLRLLHKAKITTLDEIEHVSRQNALELQLPWDLVCAVQRRLRVWKMEMQDTAELELDKSEIHYKGFEKEFPDEYIEASKGAVLDENLKERLINLPDQLQRIEETLGHFAKGGAAGNSDLLQSEVRDFSRSLEGKIDDLRTNQTRSIDDLRMAQARHIAEIESRIKEEAASRAKGEDQLTRQQSSNLDESGKIQASITRMSQSMESWMIEVSQLQQQMHISRKADSQATQVMQHLQSSFEALSTTVDDKAVSSSSQLQKVEGMMEKSTLRMEALKREQDEGDAKVAKLVGKTMEDVEEIKHALQSSLASEKNKVVAVASQEAEVAQAIQKLQSAFEALPRTFDDKLKALSIRQAIEDVADRMDRSVGDCKTSIQSELGNINSANALASSSMMDIRRLCMMVLEQATGAHERSQGNGTKLQELQSLMEGESPSDRLLRGNTDSNRMHAPPGSSMTMGQPQGSIWDRQPSGAMASTTSGNVAMANTMPAGTVPARPSSAHYGRQIMKGAAGNFSS